MMMIERLPVLLRPGFDCITGTHCEHAGKPGLNHGIHGDEYGYAVGGEMSDGRRAALVLTVYTKRFPDTVEPWRRGVADHALPRYPMGAHLMLHLQAPAGAESEYGSVSDRCSWIGEGRRCHADGSFTMATHFYESYGKHDDDNTADLMVQSDAFWDALASQFERWLVRQ